AGLRPAEQEHGLLARVRSQGGWGVLGGGAERFRGEALAALFAASPVWSPLARPLRGGLGDRLGRLVGGAPGAPRAGAADGPPAWAPPGGLIANAIIVFCLAYVFACNAVAFASTQLRLLYPEQARERLPLLPDQFGQLGSALGIDQAWGLFAPQPGRHGGWVVVAGTQKDGRQVDALNGGARRPGAQP